MICRCTFLYLMAALCAWPAHAENVANRPPPLPGSESPDRSLALSLMVNNQKKIADLRLISSKGDTVLAAFPLSRRVRKWGPQQIQTTILWSADNSALVLQVTDGTNGEVYACVKTKDGAFKTLNVTDTIRGSALGILGRSEGEFVRFEHQPGKWGTVSAPPGHSITFRSRLWDKRGKPHTVNGSLVIDDKGEVIGP